MVATLINLTIRPAEKTDLSRLLDLYGHLNANDTRCQPDQAIEVFERLLGYDGSAILIGMIGEEMVTSCTIIVIPNLTRPKLAFRLGGHSSALIEYLGLFLQC